MTEHIVHVQTLSAEAFRPYGDVLEATGQPTTMINDGLCARYNDLANVSFKNGGKAGLSLFDATPRSLPYSFDLVERHPLGSQTFIPMNLSPFLVIVAPDQSNTPGKPQAFMTNPGQGINFHAGTWHGVLTPLSLPGLFAVVDRIGPGNNLEEFRYTNPFTVVQDGWQ